MAKTITKPFVCPEGDKDSWSEIAVKEYNANFKAHYALFQALNDDDISQVINCVCAHDIWQVFITSQKARHKLRKLR